MVRDRLDTIAKTIVIATSRRTALAGLLGGVLTLPGRTAAGAGPAARGTCKPKCDRCEKCKEGRCRPKRNGKKCGQFRVCQRGRCRELKCGKGGPCRVFVTSSTHTGNLFGLGGADNICQQLAEGAGLPGRYLSWLSDSASLNGTPVTRFTNQAKAGPYVLVNGTKIADSFADLTDSGLAAPIDRTEKREVISGAFEFVFTNTNPNGDRTNSGLATTCSNYTSESGSSSFGDTAATDYQWTDANSFNVCGGDGRLYCFQQA